MAKAALSLVGQPVGRVRPAAGGRDAQKQIADAAC